MLSCWCSCMACEACAELSCLHALTRLEASAGVLPGPKTNTTSCIQQKTQTHSDTQALNREGHKLPGTRNHSTHVRDPMHQCHTNISHVAWAERYQAGDHGHS